MSARWSRDNIYVGRGATNHYLSAVSSANNRHQVSYPESPLYFPPRPNPYLASSPRGSRHPPPVPDPAPPGQNVDVDDPLSTEELMGMPYEGEMEYKIALKSLRLSEKVHILGFTRIARYIAHCLAGTPGLPPPQLLADHMSAIRKWGEAGRQIQVVTRKGLHRLKHPIPPPQIVGRNSGQLDQMYSDQGREHIDNLIVACKLGAMIPALRDLLGRIDQHTTICLVSEGLGMTEHLNETLFPDPKTRPTYVLAYSDHLLARDPTRERSGTSDFVVRLDREGSFYLTSFARETSGISHMDTWSRVARSQHLIKLLSQAPGLNAKARPTIMFLHKLLPVMIYQSLADALSVALGCHYEGLYCSSPGKGLWNATLDETLKIVCNLPEVQKYPVTSAYWNSHEFRADLWQRLTARRGPSPWIAAVRDGRPTPIHYINRYFITRAREMDLPCPKNQFVMGMVLSRQKARREELMADVPMYRTAKIIDGDIHTAEYEDGVPGPPPEIVYLYNKRALTRARRRSPQDNQE